AVSVAVALGRLVADALAAAAGAVSAGPGCVGVGGAEAIAATWPGSVGAAVAGGATTPAGARLSARAKNVTARPSMAASTIMPARPSSPDDAFLLVSLDVSLTLRLCLPPRPVRPGS